MIDRCVPVTVCWCWGMHVLNPEHVVGLNRSQTHVCCQGCGTPQRAARQHEQHAEARSDGDSRVGMHNPCRKIRAVLLAKNAAHVSLIPRLACQGSFLDTKNLLLGKQTEILDAERRQNSALLAKKQAIAWATRACLLCEGCHSLSVDRTDWIPLRLLSRETFIPQDEIEMYKEKLASALGECERQLIIIEQMGEFLAQKGAQKDGGMEV